MTRRGAPAPLVALAALLLPVAPAVAASGVLVFGPTVVSDGNPNTRIDGFHVGLRATDAMAACCEIGAQVTYHEIDTGLERGFAIEVLATVLGHGRGPVYGLAGFGAAVVDLDPDGNRSEPTPVLAFGAGASAESVEIGLSFHAAMGEGIRHFDFYTDISLGLRF
jgi:hypothetical protein